MPCNWRESHDNGLYWVGTSNSAVPSFPGHLEQVAVSRALLKLKMSRPNLAVAFAERHETKRTVMDAMKSIAHSVSSFRKSSPALWGQVIKNGTKNQLHGIPRKWLALQYGWKPLMSDVNASCNALANRERDSQLYKLRVVGTSSEKFTTHHYKGWNDSGFQVTDEGSHIAKAVLYYSLRNGALATFSSLGLTNPLELGWERVPYSFVIDWFLPVSNWLSTLDADLGWDFHSGTLTKFSRMNATSYFSTSASGMAAAGLSRVDWLGDTYRAHGIVMSRTVYVTSPWAGLPHFKNPFSSLHVANALSLLTEAFRR